MSIRPARSEDIREFGPVEPSLDHLVYAVPDLDTAAREFTARQPVCHPCRADGTWAAYPQCPGGLGKTSYLEIIGPNLDNPADAGAAIPFGVNTLIQPRLATWPLHPADIELAAAASAAAGADLGPVGPLSRRTPRSAPAVAARVDTPAAAARRHSVRHRLGHDHAPRTSPTSSQAARPKRTHPDPDAVTAVLDALNVQLIVQPGPSRLQALLDTPRGAVILD